MKLTEDQAERIEEVKDAVADFDFESLATELQEVAETIQDHHLKTVLKGISYDLSNMQQRCETLEGNISDYIQDNSE